MIDYAFIGARLREARIRKNMTQEQLAAMTDVGSTHISHIETGMTIPSTKGITADVSTGVKKQYTPARIIRAPRITDITFLVIMIHISLPESKLPTVMGGELSRNRLAFDGDVFLLGQLRFCFLLRDL